MWHIFYAKNRSIHFTIGQPSEGSLLFDANSNIFFVAGGDADPVKVVRTALQNAVSIAGLILTTEILITEKPELAGTAPTRWRGCCMGDCML